MEQLEFKRDTLDCVTVCDIRSLSVFNLKQSPHLSDATLPQNSGNIQTILVNNKLMILFYLNEELWFYSSAVYFFQLFQKMYSV